LDLFGRFYFEVIEYLKQHQTSVFRDLVTISTHLDPFVSQQQLVKDGPSRLFRTERIPFGQVQQLTVRFKEQETGIEENILLDLI
jgi:hypothetical protein